MTWVRVQAGQRLILWEDLFFPPVRTKPSKVKGFGRVFLLLRQMTK